MKRFLLASATVVGILAGVAACDENPTPTVTTTTTTTTSVAATTTSTTTSVSVPTTFSATGAVVEESTNQPISGAELEILNGPNAGRTFQTDSAGLYSITGLSAGSFTVRFRATGYDPADRLITITNANVRTDVALRKTVTTTTTTTSVPSTALRADFTVTPVPCTITGAAAVVDCTVDSAPSTGAITSYTWTYLGITVTNNFRFVLALTCANTGATQEATIQVTLAVTDATPSQNSTTKPVTVRKSNACGFGP